jgi:hypothetical protein
VDKLVLAPKTGRKQLAATFLLTAKNPFEINDISPYGTACAQSFPQLMWGSAQAVFPTKSMRYFCARYKLRYKSNS